ncbi:2-amino-4-hydroxy-6-hydroxymethyldihydropteridine diphosphokinase [Henriciella mobilis]|uniref:2-amino-4-hydroxy-6-hydroxymethyldihydropteridine pyrophosphokinase n=1 Tax=Henriciella mobilis TaxID=2305467 RepID=A0A399RKE4_9PROT|nr:2-amino-4-hydroxy-6-hydroxymethyldihydropteridine diphosphokinase [Henriciella mobilis]RIJ30322.1 2-amino-4-hydroxy-6-hydroxymethyldihydropteridine diphosphokinase [Henriciella mobilis]
MKEAALAFGSNLGDSRAMIERAIAVLGEMAAVRVTRVSSFYRTPPWGVDDQPDFINACALVETSYSPEALLAACKDLEKALGREEATRWGPRLIDVDVLWMAGETRDTATLSLPHPRLTERAFVLVPLAEIGPNLEIGGARVQAHLARLKADDRDAVIALE